MAAFRAAMGQLGLKGKLIATDMSRATSAFPAADLGLVVPPIGRVEYIPALLDIVRKHEISLLVPLTDLDLRSLARQRDKFAEIGCTVMIASEPAVMMCRDKTRTNKLLRDAGLAAIKTFTLAEFREEPFFPCFIKPIRGSAGVGTGVIRSRAQLDAHVAAYGELMLVQQYVTGSEYTIDVYRSRDGQVRCVVPRQRLVVRSGEVAKAVTIKDYELIDATILLSRHSGDLWGVFCCQCRRAKGQPPRFFEINPRFGGGSPLSIAAGANLPLYLLQEVTGRPITAEVGEFTPDLLMLRYDEAFFVPAGKPDELPGYDTPFFK